MKAQPKIADAAAPPLTKPDPNSPVLKVTGRSSIVVKAGTGFGGYTFKVDTPIAMPSELEVGADYAVLFVAGGDGPSAVKLIGAPENDLHLGGFHFAPGGNAPGRAGGDDTPAINPRSLWDLKFRPDGDPRGQTFVDRFGVKFWGDIYMLGVDHHINGTSKFGVTIADGNDPPINPETGKKFARLDYATAVAVMRHHDKGLMSYDEFRAFAFGVTEKTARGKDPKITGLDMDRTSQDGGMQSAGNLWAWGHDGDPDEPRASVFGGSWVNGGHAGSRYAVVAYDWPDSSGEFLGARGRSDTCNLPDRRGSDGD